MKSTPSNKEIGFFKQLYSEEPHSWVNPMFISRSDWPPPQDWLDEAPHLNHKMIHKRASVCLCVWERFGEVSNRALIDYFKLIIPHVHLPLDLDGFMKIVDGRHRLIAYKELDIMCPVYIGRKRVRYGTCWQKGLAYNDGTVDKNVRHRSGYYDLK